MSSLTRWKSLLFVLAITAGCGDDDDSAPGSQAAGSPAVAGDGGADDEGHAGRPTHVGGTGGPTMPDGGFGGGGEAGARDVSAGAPSAVAPSAGGADAGAAGAGGDGVVGDASRDILDTSLDIDMRTKAGTAIITLAGSESTGASFEIGDLEIGSVTSNGEALRFRAEGSVLDVQVPASTEPLVLRIDYTWRFHEKLDGISSHGFSLTWPYYCGNVFPCHSSPSDGTTFHLNVTGVSAPNTVIYPTEIRRDAPPYMAAWAIGNYTELPLGETSAGTSVSTWYKAGGRADAEDGTAHLVAAFDWLEQEIGPYRFGSHVGSVSVEWRDGGMEHHPFWHVAENTMSDEVSQVHEAAHGWFGDGVRLRCWEDFVLSEGTATYLAARALEAAGGTDVSDAVWSGYESELEGMRAPGASSSVWPQSCGEIDVLASGLFSRQPYIKGAFFYRGLEQQVGRASLDEALRTFYERFAGQAAGMQDLLDVVAEVTDYDAEPCAQAWLIDATPVPAIAACP